MQLYSASCQHLWGCNAGRYELEYLFHGYPRENIYVFKYCFSPLPLYAQCFQAKEEINLQLLFL